MKNLVNKIRSWTEAPNLEQIPESLRENAISISTVSCPEKFLAPMSHHDSMIFFWLRLPGGSFFMRPVDLEVQKRVNEHFGTSFEVRSCNSYQFSWDDCSARLRTRKARVWQWHGVLMVGSKLRVELRYWQLVICQFNILWFFNIGSCNTADLCSKVGNFTLSRGLGRLRHFS